MIPFYRPLLMVGLLILVGCAGQQAKANLELDTILATGNYADAARTAESRMGLKSEPEALGEPPVVYNPKHVLLHMEAAEAWRMSGNVERAIDHYDAAESALGDTSENVTGNAAGKVGAALVNETLSSYMPSPAESILINYYKALIFWSVGKPDLARVELNRADDRTRRAVERYSKEIEAASEDARKKKSDQTYSNPQVANTIDAQFPEMAQWAPYAEFIVPPATYLQALFLGTSSDAGDRGKAKEIYDRLAGIVGPHTAIAADIAEVSDKGLCPAEDCIWVLVENGLGPELQERKFSYPAFSGNGVVNVQMALPALVSRFDPSNSRCAIEYAGTEAPCESFASMDRVIQTEFSKRFPGIVTRAVVSTVVKAVAQDQASRQGGLLGGLVAAIVTDAVTTADIRMWRSMPSQFTLNRFHRNGEPLAHLIINGQTTEIDVSGTGRKLVHVKSASTHLPPTVTVVNI